MKKGIGEIIMFIIQIAFVLGAIQFGWWVSNESMTYLDDYDLRIRHMALEGHGYNYCPYCGEYLKEVEE